MVLSEYVVRYVQSEPRPPSNWARPKKGCGCDSCQDLDKFLLDPDTEVSHFTVAQPIREHLTSHLGFGYDLRTEKTTARGRAYTVVITKTLRGYEQEKKAWERRCEQGMQQIQDLGSESLMKTLLGDIFERIWSLDARGIAPYGPDPRASTSTEPDMKPLALGTMGFSRMNRTAQPLSPITNRKRPLIDLTRDSD